MFPIQFNIRKLRKDGFYLQSVSNKFRVYLIHSNCAILHNLFFSMMDYGENGYLHSKVRAKMTEN